MRKKLAKKLCVLGIGVSLMCSLAACGAVENDKDNQSNESQTVIQNTDNATTQNEATNTAQTTTEQSVSEDNTTTEEQQGSVTGELNFDEVNKLAGATDNWTAEDWVSWADDMFATACQVEWDYSQDCKIRYDFNDTIEYDGYDYYKAKDYNTYEEMTADYYSLFSRAGREHVFDEMYVEQEGAIYVRTGSRGANIFYIESKVASVDAVYDNVIEFTVDSYYMDPDHYETEDAEDYIYSEGNKFSVIFEDRVWKVKDFTLPY